MSFLKYKRRIAEGDTVILCRGRERSFAVRVERGRVIQVKGGAVHHDYIIGREFGAKIYTLSGKGWVIPLHPTPELWTLTLPHRTQILYSTDISLITFQLELRPGSVVIESGTGSGSVSHAVARTVAPEGHLYSFEFHEQRAKLASEDFAAHGLSEVVTVACRDVCRDGFGLENEADAVFLDLPNPWEAISHAERAMKASSGRLCCFSPCIEQVQRSCEQLQSCGFVDVEVMECLHRPFDVRQSVLHVPSLGFATQPTSRAPQVPRPSTDKSHDSHVTIPEELTDHFWSGKLTKPRVTEVTLDSAQPTRTIPGHTGYLVFATLNHKYSPSSSSLPSSSSSFSSSSASSSSSSSSSSSTTCAVTSLSSAVMNTLIEGSPAPPSNH